MFQFRNVQTIFSRHCALLGQIRIEITEEVQVQIVEAEDAQTIAWYVLCKYNHAGL